MNKIIIFSLHILSKSKFYDIYTLIKNQLFIKINRFIRFPQIWDGNKVFYLIKVINNEAGEVIMD